MQKEGMKKEDILDLLEKKLQGDYSYDKETGTLTYAVWIGLDRAKVTLKVIVVLHMIFLIPLLLLPMIQVKYLLSSFLALSHQNHRHPPQLIQEELVFSLFHLILLSASLQKQGKDCSLDLDI